MINYPDDQKTSVAEIVNDRPISQVKFEVDFAITFLEPTTL